MKRALSLREITRCEDAREPVCHCRCGGVLHGAGRGTGREFFESLPETDPHYYPSQQARQERKQREREERDRRRYQVLAEIYGSSNAD